MLKIKTIKSSASASASILDTTAESLAPRTAIPQAPHATRTNRKAFPTYFDCSAYTSTEIQALLLDIDPVASQHIKTLDFTNNQNLTDDLLKQLLEHFHSISDLHIEGTAVNRSWQNNAKAFFKVRKAMVALDFLPQHNRNIIASETYTPPSLPMQNHTKRALQKFIRKLQDPANQQHIEQIQRLDFLANPHLTDTLFNQIVDLLPQLTHVLASYTDITQLPPAIARCDHLKEITCSECPNIIDRTRPTGLRDTVIVNMTLMTPAQRFAEQALTEALQGIL